MSGTNHFNFGSPDVVGMVVVSQLVVYVGFLVLEIIIFFFLIAINKFIFVISAKSEFEIR